MQRQEQKQEGQVPPLKAPFPLPQQRQQVEQEAQLAGQEVGRLGE